MSPAGRVMMPSLKNECSGAKTRCPGVCPGSAHIDRAGEPHTADLDDTDPAGGRRSNSMSAAVLTASARPAEASCIGSYTYTIDAY